MAIREIKDLIKTATPGYIFLGLFQVFAIATFFYFMFWVNQENSRVLSGTKRIHNQAFELRAEQQSILGQLAAGSTMFAHDLGCAPGGPADLVGQPTADRLFSLGCKPGSKVRGDYIPPTMLELAKDVTFVRRWDGLLVIEYLNLGGDKKQCSFLDAEHSTCQTGMPKFMNQAVEKY